MHLARQEEESVRRTTRSIANTGKEGQRDVAGTTNEPQYCAAFTGSPPALVTSGRSTPGGMVFLRNRTEPSAKATLQPSGLSLPISSLAALMAKVDLLNS